MSKYVRFIYNPHSGENKILSHLDYIIEAYQSHGYTIMPYRIGAGCSIKEALVSCDNLHHILIAGGDGTINSVVNEMKSVGLDIPIATLPAGTANDFAKLMGYSSNLKYATSEILNGVVKEVDLGKADDKYFVNVLSTGLFTDISQKTPTILKNTFGKFAYYFTSYISTIQELPSFRKINVSVESAQINYNDDSLIIFVFNGRTAGNMNFAYNSDYQDGLLDVIIIRGENIAETLRAAVHFFTWQQGDYPHGVVHFKTEKLLFSSSDDLTVDIDGEPGPSTPMRIECIHKGLKIIVPKR